MFVLFVVLLAVIAMPNQVNTGRHNPRIVCVANLKFIEGAKAFWALENKKHPSDVPKDADIFGRDKAISMKPKCPAGGIYTLNAVSELQQCSVHGDLSQWRGGK